MIIVLASVRKPSAALLVSAVTTTSTLTRTGQPALKTIIRKLHPPTTRHPNVPKPSTCRPPLHHHHGAVQDDAHHFAAWADQVMTNTQLSLRDAGLSTHEKPSWRSVVRDDKPQSHRAYDQVTTYLRPTAFAIAGKSQKGHTTRRIGRGWSPGQNQSKQGRASCSKLVTCDFKSFGTTNDLRSVVGSNDLSYDRSHDDTIDRVIDRCIPRLIVPSVFGCHDLSYAPSQDITSARTIGHSMPRLLVRSGAWCNDRLIVPSVAGPHVRTYTSRCATAAGDRSKNCRSVAPWPNRNQSYDPEILRSSVTVALPVLQRKQLKQEIKQAQHVSYIACWLIRHVKVFVLVIYKYNIRYRQDIFTDN